MDQKINNPGREQTVDIDKTLWNWICIIGENQLALMTNVPFELEVLRTSAPTLQRFPRAVSWSKQVSWWLLSCGANGVHFLSFLRCSLLLLAVLPSASPFPEEHNGTKTSTFHQNFKDLYTTQILNTGEVSLFSQGGSRNFPPSKVLDYA